MYPRSLVARTSIFLLLNHSNHAFMGTDPLLAWSNAPGASLRKFPSYSTLGEDPIVANSPNVDQIPLNSNSQAFCPTGSSSLLIFTLNSSDHQKKLKNRFLSFEINQEVNSVPNPSRFWSDNFPISAGSSISELTMIWPTLCQESVIFKDIQPHEEINVVFQNTVRKINGPRMVIFTTPAMMAPKSFLGTQSEHLEKRQLLPEISPENISSSDSTEMPSPKLGVFWRYTFVSDYLIIGVLVMILLFIPPVVLGCFALQSIESPKGLKTKMVGQVSEVKGN